METERDMVLALSSNWTARLREMPESGMTYQMVTLLLSDGRRFERVPFCDGRINLTGLDGFWKVPFSESEIADIVVTHDRSGPPRLVAVAPRAS